MSGEALIPNFDLALFLEKRVGDYLDAQRPNGGFTETAPFVGIADAGLGGDSGPIGWQVRASECRGWRVSVLARRASAPAVAWSVGSRR